MIIFLYKLFKIPNLKGQFKYPQAIFYNKKLYTSQLRFATPVSRPSSSISKSAICSFSISVPFF